MRFPHGQTPAQEAAVEQPSDSSRLRRRLPLLCDFGTGAAHMPAAAPAPAMPGPRVGARLSRDGRLHCLLPAAGSPRPPSPEASTPTAALEPPGSDGGKEGSPALDAAAMADFGRRPISRLTQQYNRRLQELLVPPPAVDSSPRGKGKALFNAAKKVLCLPKLAGRVAAVTRMFSGGKQRRAAPAQLEEPPDTPEARTAWFNQHVADMLCCLDSTALRRPGGGEADRKDVRTGTAGHVSPARSGRAGGRSRAPGPRGGRAARAARAATEPQRNPYEEKVLREEDFWFLDSDQVTSSDTSAEVAAQRRAQAHRSLYSEQVLRVLRTHPNCHAAFDEKVQRLRRIKHTKKVARLAETGDWCAHNLAEAFRSPRDRQKDQQLWMQVHDERMRRAIDAAQAAEEELQQHKLATLTEQRQAQMRRGKALAAAYFLTKANAILGSKCTLWRDRMALDKGWTKQKRTLRLLRDTISGIKSYAEQGAGQGNEHQQQALRAARMHEALAQSISRSVLQSHSWMFAMRLRILRKRHAITVIVRTISCESQKSMILTVIKSLLRATRRIQRWWRMRMMLVVLGRELLNRQWQRYLMQMMTFDAERVARTLAQYWASGTGAPGGSGGAAAPPRVAGLRPAVQIARRQSRAPATQGQSFRQRPKLRSGSGAAGRSFRRAPQARASGGISAVVRRGAPPEHLERMGVLTPCVIPIAPPDHRPLKWRGDAGYQERWWQRCQVSIAVCARFAMDILQREQLDIEPPQDIRDRIISLVLVRERLLFRLRLTRYETKMTAAVEEWNQLQALLRAKQDIHPLTREDVERLEGFEWPVRPLAHKVLQANEMRLCVAIAYQAYRIRMARNVARRGSGSPDGEGLPPMLVDVPSFLAELQQLQEDVGLGGVWKGFWVQLPEFEQGLQEGRWDEPRHVCVTETRVKVQGLQRRRSHYAGLARASQAGQTATPPTESLSQPQRVESDRGSAPRQSGAPTPR
eukprot:TRINITY_DN5492_c5_g1_i1.p1 TRINITY_DN5492_c5_g1~~TRINITY_DN5492_c5_g1_i1.p1  ORF type:complete len:977 (+),score=199.73 TRINITY_DN5492_c5_g1_i1:152-3082(+)